MQQAQLIPRLFVTAVEATGLKSTNFFSESTDSYCIVELKSIFSNGAHNAFHRTATQKRTVSPAWNEIFEFHLSDQPHSEVLFVTVMSHSSFGKDKPVGRVEVPASLLCALPNYAFDCWFKLLGQKGENILGAPGHVRLILQYLPYNDRNPVLTTSVGSSVVQTPAKSSQPLKTLPAPQQSPANAPLASPSPVLTASVAAATTDTVLFQAAASGQPPAHNNKKEAGTPPSAPTKEVQEVNPKGEEDIKSNEPPKEQQAPKEQEAVKSLGQPMDQERIYLQMQGHQLYPSLQGIPLDGRQSVPHPPGAVPVQYHYFVQPQQQ